MQTFSNNADFAGLNHMNFFIFWGQFLIILFCKPQNKFLKRLSLISSTWTLVLVFFPDCYICQIHKGTTKNFQNLSPDALKIHSLALCVIRFPCKRFSKLHIFTLQNILLCRWFFKKLCIWVKRFYGYKLVRAAKWSKMKRCSK